jgi:hypothetical protein
MHACREFTVSDMHPIYNNYWRPPLTIDECEGEQDGLMGSTSMAFHKIYGNGIDLYSVQRLSYFRCAFDFSDMPYDSFTCSLTFRLRGISASVSSTSTTAMNLEWVGISSDELSSAEWDIQQGATWETTNEIRRVSGLFGVMEDDISVLTAKFKFNRRPAHILEDYVVTCILFYFASWLGMFIDLSAVPARTFFAMIPVLLMVSTQSRLTAAMPPIGYTTRLQSFLTLSLAFTVGHCLEFALSHYMANLERELDESKRAASDTLEEGQDEVTSFRGWKRVLHRALKACKGRVEFHCRWVSPVLYAALVYFILWPPSSE